MLKMRSANPVVKCLHRVVLLAAALSLCLGGMLNSPAPAVAASQSTSVPDLDIMLVIDQSDTMYYRNDTESWRIKLAKLFADLLSVDQSGSNHRLGVVMFGKPEMVSPLIEIQNATQREHLKGLLDIKNKSLVTTDINGALRMAQNELDTNGRPEAQHAIILISDGMCDLTGQMTPTEILNCHTSIREAAYRENGEQYPIFVVALTNDAQRNARDYKQYRVFWQEVAGRTNGLYFEPTNSEDQLLNAYMQIMRHLFRLPPEAVTVVNVPVSVKFDITAGYQQIIFTAVKYKTNITTRVIRPDGKTKITESSADGRVQVVRSPNTDVFSIQEPEAGQWVVQLDGEGSASVMSILTLKSALAVHVITPGASHPMGKPMEIALQVLDADNRPQDVNDTLSGMATLPDGRQFELDFEEADNYIYRATLTDTRLEGMYTIQFQAPTGADGAPLTQEMKVNVVKQVWLDAWLTALPSCGAGLLPEVQAQLMFGPEPYRLESDDDVVLKLTVLSLDNLEILSKTLGAQDFQVGGLASTQLADLRAGDYRLNVIMVYKNLTSGASALDFTEMPMIVQTLPTCTPVPTEVVPPTVAPATDTPVPIPPTDTPAPPTPTKLPTPTRTPIPKKPIPPLAIAGGVVACLFGLLLLGGGGGAAYWFFSRPQLIGELEGLGGMMPVPLHGRNAMYIGSDPRCQINVMEEGIQPRHARLRPIGSRKTPQVELRTLVAGDYVKINGLESTFQILQDGDKIQVGSQVFQYHGPAGSLSPTDPFTTTASSGTDDWKF